jgi:hypothetical protein
MDTIIYDLITEYMKEDPDITLNDLTSKIHSYFPLFEIDIDLIRLINLSWSIKHTSHQIRQLAEETS